MELIGRTRPAKSANGHLGNRRRLNPSIVPATRFGTVWGVLLDDAWAPMPPHRRKRA